MPHDTIERIIITFKNKSYEPGMEQKIPCNNYAIGSLVHMKNEDPWLDYANVPVSLFLKTLRHVRKLNKDVDVKIIYLQVDTRYLPKAYNI